MTSPANATIPDIAQVLAQILQRVPPAQQPLLIALAERLAAERYRAWASESTMVGHRDELLSCAEREEEIATAVEGLDPQAAATQQAILAANPDLAEVNRELFARRPLPQQFAMQAQGERMGALTWRALAQRAPSDEARATLMRCAELEEQSAIVLEAILADPSFR